MGQRYNLYYIFKEEKEDRIMSEEGNQRILKKIKNFLKNNKTKGKDETP